MKINPLDKLFSEYVRKLAVLSRGGCERCLTPYEWKRLQCSHFWGRAKRSTRYLETNAAGLCYGCHRYFTSHPAEHAAWFLNRLGQARYDILDYTAHKPQKIDESAIALYLKAQLNSVDKCCKELD